jgi:hypothetical protein
MRNGHLQGGQGQCLVIAIAHRPTDHPPRVQVEQHGQVGPSGSRANEGDVTHPNAVRFVSMEMSLNKVRNGGGHLVVFHRDAKTPLAPGFDAGIPPQTRHPVLASGHVLLVQHLPSLDGAIGVLAGDMQMLDLGQQRMIGQGMGRRCPVSRFVVAAAVNFEHPTHRGNPELRAMCRRKRVLHGSSRVKYAAAFLGCRALPLHACAQRTVAPPRRARHRVCVRGRERRAPFQPCPTAFAFCTSGCGRCLVPLQSPLPAFVRVRATERLPT